MNPSKNLRTLMQQVKNTCATDPQKVAAFDYFSKGVLKNVQNVACFRCDHAVLAVTFGTVGNSDRKQNSFPDFGEVKLMACSKFARFASPHETSDEFGFLSPVLGDDQFFCSSETSGSAELREETSEL